MTGGASSPQAGDEARNWTTLALAFAYPLSARIISEEDCQRGCGIPLFDITVCDIKGVMGDSLATFCSSC